MRLYIFVALILSAPQIYAEKSLDLDDISIKGELHNDDRLRLISRGKNALKNYVKFRVNYRKEIIEELPAPNVRYK